MTMETTISKQAQLLPPKKTAASLELGLQLQSTKPSSQVDAPAPLHQGDTIVDVVLLCFVSTSWEEQDRSKTSIHTMKMYNYKYIYVILYNILWTYNTSSNPPAVEYVTQCLGIFILDHSTI